MIKYINIPGLRNSKEDHWQSHWEKEYPQDFLRVVQQNWEEPNCELWIDQIEHTLSSLDKNKLILIGHSVGCVTIIKWQQTYGHKIKGALFVAPSDVDRPDYPKYITGFSPMPLNELSFQSIVVASTNDHVIDFNRAQLFAHHWGSEFIGLGDAGHIEESTGFGKWNEGYQLLKLLS